MAEEAREEDEDHVFHWRLAKSGDHESTSIVTVDLAIQPQLTAVAFDHTGEWMKAPPTFPSALGEAMKQILLRPVVPCALMAYKVVLPRISGYWLRTNMISSRLKACAGARVVVDFNQVGEYCHGPHMGAIDASSLWFLLESAVGLIELDTLQPGCCLEQAFDDLEARIQDRLSLPLLLPYPVPKHRLALVHTRYDWVDSNHIYIAAAELGIDVYVVAEQGHWMQDGAYTSFRKDFIPVDVHKHDGTLVQRLVEALDQYPVRMDGIVTMTDACLIDVAYAAQALGLPTNDPSVFETCRDKYLTRLLDQPEGFESVQVVGLQGAQNMLRCGKSFNYPMIVKPCAGYGSRGVRKVFDDAELLNAADRANLTDFGLGRLVAIESYIDGPEIDANFVIWDGEVIFLEISDQAPAGADLDTASTSEPNFLETELLLPSVLPKDEQNEVRQSMLRVLEKLKAGNGVYHMEARLRDSAMEYRVVDGIRDLCHKDNKPLGRAQCILIENNCRPPGTNSNPAILYAYGVDLCAMHMLVAVADGARVRALGTPFKAGSQCIVDLVSIPVVRGGIMASRDATGDLLRRFPDVKGNVVECGTFFRYGEEVPDERNGVVRKIAYFILASASRVQLMRTAQKLRDCFEYQVVQRREELMEFKIAAG